MRHLRAGEQTIYGPQATCNSPPQDLRYGPQMPYRYIEQDDQCRIQQLYNSLIDPTLPFNVRNRSKSRGSSKHTALPTSTRMTMATSDYLRNYFTREAEERLRDSIPVKIRQLDELLRDSQFDVGSSLKRIKLANDNLTQRVEESSKMAGETKATPLSLTVTVNEVVEQAQTVLRPYVLSLAEDAQILRMWIQLNVPRIEDGNNFGVSVQEEVLMETNKAEMDANAMLDFYGDYLMYRAKLASKVLKWPMIADYRRALADSDDGAFIRIRMYVRDVRNLYSHLYDIYHKNSQKLRVPRTDAEGQFNIMY